MSEEEVLPLYNKIDEDELLYEINLGTEFDLTIDEELLSPYNEIDADDHQRDSDLESFYAFEQTRLEEEWLKTEQAKKKCI